MFFYEKNCLPFLVVITVFLNSFSAIAETEVLVSEPEYDNSSVIVILKHEYSIVGKTYTVEDFNCELISSIKDLTPVTNIEDSKYDFDVWKKIFQVFLNTPSNYNVEKIINELSVNEIVESVRKNYAIEMDDISNSSVTESYNYGLLSTSDNNGVSAFIQPNAPGIDLQYGISNATINKAWGITTGNSSVTVGVIDSGINEHPDLIDNLSISQSRNFTNEPGLEDNVGHGTHVAGIIGACGNNGFGVVGVCWDVTLINLKAYKKVEILDPVTSEVVGYQGLTYYAWVVDAIGYAANIGIDVLNISGKCHNEFIDELEAQIDNYNGIIVASAGNEGSQQIYHPAGYDSNKIISVTHIDSNDQLYYKNGILQSNYNNIKVDLAAPGVDIASTYLNNGYGSGTGSSMAAPYVTGTVALLLSINPNLTVQQIRNLIFNNVTVLDSLDDKVYTEGKLNVFDAVIDASGYIVGDVNLDGVITAADSRLVLRYSSQSEIPNNVARVLSDIDNDDYITAADARLVLQMSSGIS